MNSILLKRYTFYALCCWNVCMFQLYGTRYINRTSNFHFFVNIIRNFLGLAAEFEGWCSNLSWAKKLDSSYIIRPISLHGYRTFQRSKFRDWHIVVHLHVENFEGRSFQRSKVKLRTCSYQHFDVRLHVRSFSNVHLRCNFMGLTI